MRRTLLSIAAAAAVLVIGVIVYFELVLAVMELATGTADGPVDPIWRLGGR